MKYHRALITQNNIGWRQIFMGRISQEWLKIQGSNMTTNGTRRKAYIWGASVVEVSITSFIELWEQRTSNSRFVKVRARPGGQKMEVSINQIS